MKYFILTGITPLGGSLVKKAYEQHNSKVKHVLLQKEPYYSFKAIVTDRNLLKKPFTNVVFSQSIHVIMKAGGATEKDYVLEMHLE